MSESRIQDWIRYVQEKAENVAEPNASTRASAQRESVDGEIVDGENADGEAVASPPTSREETAETPESSGAQAAEKRVSAALRARRIASLRAETPDTATTDTASQTPGATAGESRAGGNKAAVKAVVEARATAPVPRRRIRPETRAQMLDRLTNPTISLHEASVILGVCSATVRRLTDDGTLPHERTTGGQRRFRLAEVLKLYRARHGEKSSK